MSKILFIGTPSILLYSSSIKKSLLNLGQVIVEPEYLKFKDQNPVSKKIKSMRKAFLKKFFAKQNEKYIAAAEKHKPDFVFVINNSRMSESFLEYCRTKNLPVYMYCIDSIRWCDKALEHMHYYTDIFSYEPSDEKIEFSPGKFVKFIPLGFDKEIYHPLDNIEKKYDICFVGRLEKRRLEMMEKIAEYAYNNHKSMILYTSIQLKKIPHFWLFPKLFVRQIKFKLKYPHLMKFLINEPILGRELNRLYNQSKICLNLHVGTHAGMHTGPNPRTFELLGSGAFEIIDSGHLEHTILSQKDLIECSSTKEIIENIDYYLNHEQERTDIAKHGYNTTYKNYELSILLQDILNKINR